MNLIKLSRWKQLPHSKHWYPYVRSQSTYLLHVGTHTANINETHPAKLKNEIKTVISLQTQQNYLYNI
jgi:hypothetical protein